MVYTHHVLRERLHAQAGIFDRPAWPITSQALQRDLKPLLAEIAHFMANRLRMGHLRYGPMGRKLDRPASIRSRLKLYEESGNLECLVDIANLAIVEFVKSEHPRRHFSAVEQG